MSSTSWSRATIVAGVDTTYVLRTDGYTLLSHDRRLLWSRATLDAAWRKWQRSRPAARVR